MFGHWIMVIILSFSFNHIPPSIFWDVHCSRQIGSALCDVLYILQRSINIL